MRIYVKTILLIAAIVVGIILYNAKKTFNIKPIQNIEESDNNEIINKMIQQNVYVNEIDFDNRKILRCQCTQYPCGGWADRLKGIVNGFAWAMLTNRKFEINIKHPCQLKYFFETNDLNWFKSDLQMEKEKLENKSNIHMTQFQGHDLRNQMKTLDLINYNANYDIIVLETNLDWLLYLSENPLVRDKIIELGYKPHKFRTPYLFHMIYNKLFKLTPRFQQKYDDFLRKAKPNANTKLICAQYRVVYSSRINSRTFWDFVKATFINKLPDKNYRVFITTDESGVEEEAIKYFGANFTVKTEGTFANIDYPHQIQNHCSRVDKSLLDFHMMQNCDMAVISESGFGKLGVWNREDPSKNVYLFRKNKQGNYGFIKMDLDDPDAIL